MFGIGRSIALIAIVAGFALAGCTTLGEVGESDTPVPQQFDPGPEGWRFLNTPESPAKLPESVGPLHEPTPIVPQPKRFETTSTLDLFKPDLLTASVIPEPVELRSPLPLPLVEPFETRSIIESPRIADLDIALIGNDFGLTVEALPIPIPDSRQHSLAEETAGTSEISAALPEKTAPIEETPHAISSEAETSESVGRATVAEADTEITSARIDVAALDEGPIIRELPVAAIRLSRVGITIPVALDGFGWIYVPTDLDAETGVGFAYAGRDLNDSGAVFNFRIDDPGNYTLRFQRQDNATGTFESATVELLGSDAVSGNIRGVDISEGESVSATIDSDSSFEQQIQELIDDGSYDRVFSMSIERGNYSQAVQYYTDGISSAASDREIYATNRNFIDASLAAGTAEPLVKILPFLLDEPLSLTREDLEEVASFFETSGETEGTIATYGAILDHFAGSIRNDEVLILIARLYERESPFRNERLAYDHYRKLIDSFPLSRYYEEAERRMQHIERHFINIR